MVGVLILIHHYVSEAVLVLGQNVRVVLQHMQGIEQKVIEVHSIVGFQLPLILFIDIVYYLRLWTSVAVFKELLRIGVCLLFLTDDGGKVGLRELLAVYILLFYYVLYYSFLVNCIVNNEVLIIACSVIMLPQNSQAHSMESHYPHSGTWSHQLFYSVTHLFCRLVGECHCKDAVRTDALFNKICNSVGHGGCFTAAGSCKNKQRPLCMSRRLLLFFI